MGLFGKKKVTENKSDELFKQYGGETNNVTPPQKQTRKVAAQNAAAAHVSSVKKEQLLEKISQLRKAMYSRPGYDAYLDKLEETTRNLKGMQDNPNKEAMEVVDKFILKSIIDAHNYCNRGNYIALGACLDNFNSFVNDRLECGSYYTDIEFQQHKLERNRLYIEQQNYLSELGNLEKRMKQLRVDAANPALGLSTEHIAMEVQNIKAESARIKSSVNTIADRIKYLDSAIATIRDRSIAHAQDSTFDIYEKADEILGMKRENEHDAAYIDKLNEKMAESHRKVSSSSLDVNTDVFEAAPTINLDDDEFWKM